jgi:DNA-binding NarL/FixJ family response regulator
VTLGAALTAREVEVVACLADGLTNAQVGTRLGISLATVKTHLARIGAKFGTGGRAGIVGAAYLRGDLRLRHVPGAAAPQVTCGGAEVLPLVACGLSNASIAARMHVSLHAVKSRMRVLMRVFGASDRAHLVALAMDSGALQRVPRGRAGMSR